MTPRDEIWVDMTQFDTQVADAVWDGTHRDRSAPWWYRDVRSLIHCARGPAEAHELADEPAVIEAMGRTARGQHVARADTRARGPRPSGLHTLGRVVAMKAAAATTATVIGVTAAAAATTGIMATVVMPAVRHHVAPIIAEQLTPVVVHETTPESSGDGSDAHDTEVAPCPAGVGDACAALDPGTAGLPPASTTPGAAPPAAEPVAVEPVAAEPAPAEAPAEEPAGDVVPVVQDPVATEAVPVEPEPVADDVAADEPATADPEPLDAPAGDPVTPVDPAPAGDPAPSADPTPPADLTPPVDPGPDVAVPDPAPGVGPGDDHGASGSPLVDEGGGAHGHGENHGDGPADAG